MTPRTSTPRPIKRAPSAASPRLPAGMTRILSALTGWRHQLRKGSAEALALEWSDLWETRGERLLDDLVRARLGQASTAKHLIGPFQANDRVGGPPAEVSGPAPLVPLWESPR